MVLALLVAVASMLLPDSVQAASSLQEYTYAECSRLDEAAVQAEMTKLAHGVLVEGSSGLEIDALVATTWRTLGADAIPLDAVQPPLSDHLNHLVAIIGRILDGGEGAPLRPLTLPPQALPRMRRPTPAWLPIAVAGAVGVVAIAVVAAVAAR